MVGVSRTQSNVPLMYHCSALREYKAAGEAVNEVPFERRILKVVHPDVEENYTTISVDNQGVIQVTNNPPNSSCEQACWDMPPSIFER